MPTPTQARITHGGVLQAEVLRGSEVINQSTQARDAMHLQKIRACTKVI